MSTLIVLGSVSRLVFHNLRLTMMFQCLGLTTVCLVSTIDNMLSDTALKERVLSAILLPIVSNAAEHSTALMYAWRGQIEPVLEIALGSSIVRRSFVSSPGMG